MIRPRGNGTISGGQQNTGRGEVSSVVTAQKGDQFFGSFAAVTDVIFLVVVELREGSGLAEGKKDGIVAKAFVALGLEGDLALQGAVEPGDEAIADSDELAGGAGGAGGNVVKEEALSGEENAADGVVGEGDGEGDAKAGEALFGLGGEGGELLEEEAVVVFIGGVFAGEAGGANARGTAEGVDFEAGVVGEDDGAGRKGSLQGFFDGIAGEGVGGLIDRGERIGVALGIKDLPGGVEEVGQEGLEFPAFARIGGGDKKGSC